MEQKGITVGKVSAFVFAFVFLAACWGFALKPSTSMKLNELVGSSEVVREILPRADSLLLINDSIHAILTSMEIHK